MIVRTNFRFLQHVLKSFFPLLKIPDDVLLRNRKYMPRQEVFLRGVYELVSGENQQQIAQNVLGGDQPLKSRAFNSLIKHIDNNDIRVLGEREVVQEFEEIQEAEPVQYIIMGDSAYSKMSHLADQVPQDHPLRLLLLRKDGKSEGFHRVVSWSYSKRWK